MTSAHSKFSPSSLKRVMACPASYAHAEALAEIELGPQRSGEAAREGTIAHALGEFALDRGACPKTLIGKKLTVDIDGEEVVVEIDKDMADRVAVYFDHCSTLAMLAERRYIEQEVHITTHVQGHETRDLLWGTADFIALTPGERIDVVDLKFGGMPVEPENNPQLVCYLLGALELLSEDKRPNKAGLHIVQPRVSREPKIWEIDDVAALRAEWLPRLERAMERAIEAAMLTVPVEGHYQAGEHCHFCPVLTTCEHFAKRMIEITVAELEEVTPDGQLFSDRYTALVERWKAKSLITRYYQQLEEKLAGEIRRGRSVPGLKIVESLGHRKWTLDDSAMISRFRNQGLKKSDFVVETLITPAAAEKLIDSKKFFETYVTRPKSEKLVPIEDKRVSVNHAQELEILDSPAVPEASEPKSAARPAPSQSPTMALIDLGEGDELEGFDELELGMVESTTKENEDTEETIEL